MEGMCVGGVQRGVHGGGAWRGVWRGSAEVELSRLIASSFQCKLAPVLQADCHGCHPQQPGSPG